MFTDLALADNDNGVTILFNDGDGGLIAAASHAGPAGAVESVVTADFDDDGSSDVATLGFNTDGTYALSVWYDDGAGTFAGETHAVPNSSRALAAGDLDGDNVPDLVVAHTADNAVRVFLNDGTGTFGAPTRFEAGSAPVVVHLADLDLDGALDLAVSSDEVGGVNEPASVGVLFGSGSGALGAVQSYSIGTTPLELAIGDLHGDGPPELVAAGPGELRILVNEGDRTFSLGQSLHLEYAGSVALGDLNEVVPADLHRSTGYGRRGVRATRELRLRNVVAWPCDGRPQSRRHRRCPHGRRTLRERSLSHGALNRLRPRAAWNGALTPVAQKPKTAPVASFDGIGLPRATIKDFGRRPTVMEQLSR